MSEHYSLGVGSFVFGCSMDESAGLSEDPIEVARETVQYALDRLLAHNVAGNTSLVVDAHDALAALVEAARG